MSATLEQRVAALESGELERLRGLAQRRLERLREAQATVRELQSRMKAATAELADLQWAEWRAIEERDVALAERDEANTKLAKPTAQPTLLAWDIVTTLNVLARHMSDRGWAMLFRYHDNQWHALAGGNIGRGGNPAEAVNALWKAIR